MPVLLFLVGLACASSPENVDAAAGGTAAASPAAASAAAPSHADANAKGPKADPRAVFGKAAPPPEAGQAVAIFAGGCFWCVEKPFDHLDGVLATTSGYTDGPEIAPTYEEVGGHRTGHTEALRVLYDPGKVSYARLLDVFWNNIDPTQANGQFCDRGSQYRAGIYTDDPTEKALAVATRDAVAARLGQEVVTEIDAASPFWPAEDYHQDFYAKNPDHYNRYRTGCGRDRRLQQLWGEGAVDGQGEAWVIEAAKAAGVELPASGDAAGDAAGDASGDASGDATAAAGHLPTPFTADQIRDAMPVGTRLTLKMTTPAGDVFPDWEVVDATDQAVTIAYTTRSASGAVLEGPAESSDSWVTLRDHASFPTTLATREQVQIDALGKTWPGWRYVVRAADGSDSVKTFDFAADMPGPPVRMLVEQGGVERMRMELVERRTPGDAVAAE